MARVTIELNEEQYRLVNMLQADLKKEGQRQPSKAAVVEMFIAKGIEAMKKEEKN